VISGVGSRVLGAEVAQAAGELVRPIAGGVFRRMQMAARSVALLRGINVGRAKRIAMADLRRVVEDLGYGGVKTLLNSGNVVFETGGGRQDHAARIGKAVEAKLGVSSRVTVVSARELAGILRDDPLVTIADDPSRALVAVFGGPAARKLAEPFAKEDWTPDAFALGRRAAYLWCPEGILESRLADAFQRAMRDGCTMRNRATMAKILALASSD
jgi:uncharacterized protein (DUF1697 family)